MKGFKESLLKHHFFREEKHFVDMMFSFLIQLKLLHDNKIIHRDIKPDNMMFQETKDKIIFFFIDFGSSQKIDSSLEMVNTFTPLFCPPEQDPYSKSFDKKKQSYKSDVFSISKSFLSILCSSEIKISIHLEILLKNMCENDIEQRISLQHSLDTLSTYYSKNLLITENQFHIIETNEEKFIRSSPQTFNFTDNYEQLVKQMSPKNNSFSILEKSFKKEEPEIEKNDYLINSFYDIQEQVETKSEKSPSLHSFVYIKNEKEEIEENKKIKLQKQNLLSVKKYKEKIKLLKQTIKKRDQEFKELNLQKDLMVNNCLEVIKKQQIKQQQLEEQIQSLKKLDNQENYIIENKMN